MRYYLFLGGFSLALLFLGCSTPQRRQSLITKPAVATDVAARVLGDGLIDEWPRGAFAEAMNTYLGLRESFTHGSKESLGKPADDAAITEAILDFVRLPMLGRQPPLIQIRWLSSTIVVALVSAAHCSTYCCVVQSKEGKWEASASLPK